MHATGAYDADRAAALSGVPRSTLHYWARTSVLVPSVSAERVKLWSYADLMALRTIDWLRRRKADRAGAQIPPTSMKVVRRALDQLRAQHAAPWDAETSAVWVAENGELHVRGPAGPQTVAGQTIIGEAINLLAPFTTIEGLRGPDLVRPRPALRIAPGRLSGSPHIEHTRLETQAIYALERSGLSRATIGRLYPYVTDEQIDQALDLELQLAANLAIPSAA